MADNLRPSRLDQTVTRHLNFHQRRITNAAPSVDDYDYVVRKELKKFAGEVEDNLVSRVVEGGGLAYEKATFGLAIDTKLVTGEDLAPHYIVAANALRLSNIRAKVKEAATGQNIIFTLVKNAAPDYILGTNFTIPFGSLAVVEWNTFDIVDFILNDIIKVDIIQTGDPIRGSGLIIVMKFKIINPQPI